MLKKETVLTTTVVYYVLPAVRNGRKFVRSVDGI